MDAFLFSSNSSCPSSRTLRRQCSTTTVLRTQFSRSVNFHARPRNAIRPVFACLVSSADDGKLSPNIGEGLVVDSVEALEKAMSLMGLIPSDPETKSAASSIDDESIDSLDSTSSSTASSTQKLYSSQEIASTLLASTFFSDAFDANGTSSSDEAKLELDDPILLYPDAESGADYIDPLDDSQSLEQVGPSAATENSLRKEDPDVLRPPFENGDDEDMLSFSEALEHSPPNFAKSALNIKLSSVRERRQRATRLAGVDAITVPQLGALGAIEDSSEFSEIFAKGESEAQSRWHIESTRAASILALERAADEIPYSALTSIGAKICFLNAEVPFRPKPFPALRKAVFESNSVECVLCNFPILKTDLQAGYFCSQCYSKIFVQIDSPTGPLPQHKSLGDLPPDVREIVDRIWQERGAQKRNAVGNVFPGTGRANTQAYAQFWNSASSTSSEDKKDQLVGVSISTTSSSTGSTSAGGGPRVPPEPPVPLNGNGAGMNDEWVVNASDRSLRTINPIRNLVQGIDVKPNPAKELIKLSVGDPTIYGNLKVSQKGVDKYCEVIREMQSNGYSMSMGSLEARTAVAKRYSLPDAPLSPDDVVLTAGTSGAVEVAIGALANEGDNILIPQPGFPLFRTIAEGFGVECRYYKLLPNQSWAIDLEHLATLADSRTVAIVVNNPSNPCGSVFGKSHIQDLLKTASDLHLPIIADEVYADMVFSRQEFASIGSQSKSVPVLSVGGISKQFVVPGWRLGWVLIHDRGDVFHRGQVRKGIRQLTTRMLVPNTPAQAVLPTLLSDGVQDASFRKIMRELEVNAAFTVKALASAPGMRCIEPQGSMYTMVEIDANLLGFEDDMHFTKALLQEESVFVLPGQCFQAPNFVRIVFCAPHVILSEAFHRIRSFCSRHAGVL